jgi:hypothetical protein
LAFVLPWATKAHPELALSCLFIKKQHEHGRTAASITYTSGIGLLN